MDEILKALGEGLEPIYLTVNSRLLIPLKLPKNVVMWECHFLHYVPLYTLRVSASLENITFLLTGWDSNPHLFG